MFFRHFGEASSDAIELDGKSVDRGLFLGEVAGDDEGLGYEVAQVQPLSLSLPFLSVSMTR